ncbi:PepSY domain-containing protein, partial [Staphylococcus aureus]|nr:PepSY domain-containing protein [Staphylococcus aureus]
AINPPKSDLNELPWATRKNKQPASSEKGSSGHHGKSAMPQTKLDYQISIDKVVEQAQKSGIKKPFSIVYPSDKHGTFIVSNTSNS